MIISDKLQIMVPHVPLAGSSDILRAILPWVEPIVPDKDLLPIGESAWMSQWHGLGRSYSTYEDIKSEVTAYLDKGYKIIAPVRSPWERVALTWAASGKHVSPWTYMEMNHDPSAGRNMLRQAVDFSGGDPWFVVRHENFYEDWNTFTSMQGITADAVDTEPPIRQALLDEVYSDNRCIHWVAQRFSGDLELYGYDLSTSYSSSVKPTEVDTVLDNDDLDLILDDDVIEDD